MAWRIALGLVVAALMLVLVWWWRPIFLLPGTRPLVMQGGDPYLRALMRTISASESNVMRSYQVLHGGGLASSIVIHPNQCESIRGGPNRGNCSTAAGRYQLLYSTWLELSLRYHPQRQPDQQDATQLSFAPQYQDVVVHAWLADKRAWNMDIADQLRKGRIQTVLRRLSGTWTSLGFGRENNVMSRDLPRIYKELVQDELERAPPPLEDNNKKAAQR